MRYEWCIALNSPPFEGGVRGGWAAGDSQAARLPAPRRSCDRNTFAAPKLSRRRPSPGPSLGGRGVGARHAFTLLEVLIAITLAIGLIGAAVGFYQYTGDARVGINEEIDAINIRRQTMERITNDLRSALALPSVAGAMQGTTDRISFMTAALPGQAVWSVTGITETPPPAQSDIRLVSYGLLTGEDEQGQIVIYGMDTQSQRLLNAKTDEEAASEEEATANSGSVQSVLLLPAAKFVRFQYWDGSQWQPQWQDQRTLPMAVEIALGEEPLPEGTEPALYPYKLATRVVYLPGGQPAATEEESTIRGLSGGGLP